MEHIGKECFEGSGIEEITLPSTLKEIGEDTFDCCFDLRTVWVGKDCTLDVRKYVEDGVEVRRK